jgi:2-phosphosulfolactate phosphatase
MQTGYVASDIAEPVFCRMVRAFRRDGVGGFLKRVRVLMTREEVVPERLRGATAVVLDVFMATTTLLTILDNGARDVYPVASLEEAEEVGAKLDAKMLLRGGEQEAARIEGYDHGPFPEEYAPEVVRNRDVIFVTTNGTRAVADVAPADEVLLGTLRNAPAAARYLERSETESIYFVCAGSAGRFALEDFLGAAFILSYMDVEGWHLNDGAWLALDFAARHAEDPSGVLKRSRAGGWFVENDRIETLEFVADLGASGLVPEVVAGKLRPANGADRGGTA